MTKGKFAQSASCFSHKSHLCLCKLYCMLDARGPHLHHKQGTQLRCDVDVMCTCRYYVTDGAKFGAEYLLYPGDPILFHAQFTVQPVHSHQSISAKLLLGDARGSHAARKHLLIASVSTTMLQGSNSPSGHQQCRLCSAWLQGTPQNLTFITLAPEDGFGS